MTQFKVKIIGLKEFSHAIRRNPATTKRYVQKFLVKARSEYLEGINRALGELRETLHHLYIAHCKKYLSEQQYNDYKDRYNECAKMLKGLEKSVLNFKIKSSNNKISTLEPRT